MTLLALAVLFIPVALYFSHGGGTRRVWGLVSAGEEVRGGGAYRELRSPLWKHGSAPLSVRVAALSSFFLGQMIVPGALMALVGVVAAISMVSEGKMSWVFLVVQLSAPTGLLVAGYLLAAGSAMLNRADDAVLVSRRAARWALWHNGVLLVGLSVAAVVSWDRANEEAMVAGLPALYACFSIGQALLVRHAAAAIEGYTARQNEDEAPDELELVQTVL